MTRDSDDPPTRDTSLDERCGDLLDERDPDVRFDRDLVGLDSVQREALALIRGLDSEIRKFHGGVDPTDVLLLYGPPGSGKTAAAEAVASELVARCGECGNYDCDVHGVTYEDRFGRVRFLSVSAGWIADTYRDGIDATLETVFDCASDLAAGGDVVVLRLEAIDRVTPDRRGGDASDAETTAAFLTGLAQLQSVDGDVLVVGTTSYPGDLDPRFRGQVTASAFVEPPSDPADLATLWERITDGQSNADELDCRRLGEASVGFAPREVISIRRRAVREPLSRAEVDPDDLSPPATGDYLEALEAAEPELLRRYVRNISDRRGLAEGFPDLREWAAEWAGRPGIGDGRPDD